MSEILKTNRRRLARTLYLSVGIKKALKCMIGSTLLCTFAFYLAKITENLFIALLLSMNSINYELTLFSIRYLPGNSDLWNEGKILFIYSFPYLVFMLTALTLPHLIRKRFNRFVYHGVVWYAFHLMLLVASGLVTGLFRYKGPGIALAWMFINSALRFIVVAVLVLIITYLSGKFSRVFLRRAWSRKYYSSIDSKVGWIKHFVVIPYLTAMGLIVAVSYYTGYFMTNLAASLLGLLFISMIYRKTPFVNNIRS